MAYDWLKGIADEYDVIVIGSGLGGLAANVGGSLSVGGPAAKSSDSRNSSSSAPSAS